MFWVGRLPVASLHGRQHNGKSVKLMDTPLGEDPTESFGAPGKVAKAPTDAAGPGSDVVPPLPGQIRSLTNPTRLCRSRVRAEVLRTFTTTDPISSFVDDEALSTDERAKMLAQRMEAATAAANRPTPSATPETKEDTPAAGNWEGDKQEVDTKKDATPQMQLIAHVEGLNDALKLNWERGERVRALRVAIQAIKLICFPRVQQCYPSIFMLVAVVMDSLGDNVAKRLNDLASSNNPVVATLLAKGLDADADIIPPEAVEVCNNWFLKISSIRELLPRICIELALLKCTRFVAKKLRVAMNETVKRLAGQIRGVVDPLVASYIRWYIFLRAATVLSPGQLSVTLAPTLRDQLDQLAWASATAGGAAAAFDFALIQPPLQWMFDSIIGSSFAGRPTLIQEMVDKVLAIAQPEVTTCLVRALSAEELLSCVGGGRNGIDETATEVIVNHALKFSPQRRWPLLRALLLCISDAATSSLPPPLGTSRAARVALLGSVQGAAALSELPIEDYLPLLEAMLVFSCAHLEPRQVHQLLELLRQRISADKSAVLPPTAEEQLCRLFLTLVENFPAGALLTSPDLLPLIRRVSAAPRRRILCRLLPSGTSTGGLGPVHATGGAPLGAADSAAVSRHAAVVLELARVGEQSFGGRELLDAAAEEERAAMRSTIATSLTLAAPQDPEARLSYLCEARHTLSDDDLLRGTLVALALNSVRALDTKDRRQRSIAKTLVAFAHSTIPALADPHTRLQAISLAASAALERGLLAQGESLLHLAMTTLPALSPRVALLDGTVVHRDNHTRSVIMFLISIGIATPPHPRHGHCYMLNAILQWNDDYEWISGAGRIAVYCAIIRSCARALRGGLPFTFPQCWDAAGERNGVRPRWEQADNANEPIMRAENHDEGQATKDSFVAMCQLLADVAVRRAIWHLHVMGQDPALFASLPQDCLELLETLLIYCCCISEVAEGSGSGLSVVHPLIASAASYALRISRHCGITSAAHLRQAGELERYLREYPAIVGGPGGYQLATADSNNLRLSFNPSFTSHSTVRVRPDVTNGSNPALSSGLSGWSDEEQIMCASAGAVTLLGEEKNFPLLPQSAAEIAVTEWEAAGNVGADEQKRQREEDIEREEESTGFSSQHPAPAQPSADGTTDDKAGDDATTKDVDDIETIDNIEEAKDEAEPFNDDIEQESAQAHNGEQGAEEPLGEAAMETTDDLITQLVGA